MKTEVNTSPCTDHLGLTFVCFTFHVTRKAEQCINAFVLRLVLGWWVTPYWETLTVFFPRRKFSQRGLFGKIAPSVKDKNATVTHPEKRSRGQYLLRRFHFPLANCKPHNNMELGMFAYTSALWIGLLRSSWYNLTSLAYKTVLFLKISFVCHWCRSHMRVNEWQNLWVNCPFKYESSLNTDCPIQTHFLEMMPRGTDGHDGHLSVLYK